MKRLDDRTVELTPNEEWTKQWFEDLLDIGYGIQEAAERALLHFWYAYPGAEEDTEADPYSGAFFQYLLDAPQGRWTVLLEHVPAVQRANILLFLQAHTDLQTLHIANGAAPDVAFDTAYAELSGQMSRGEW